MLLVVPAIIKLRSSCIESLLRHYLTSVGSFRKFSPVPEILGHDDGELFRSSSNVDWNYRHILTTACRPIQGP